MMKRALICAAMLLLAMSGPAGAVSSIGIYPSLAPNVFGSPSWENGSPSDYVRNAMAWLEFGGAQGDPSLDPEAYKTVSTIGPRDNLVTSFNSWQGVAGPLAPPFGGELGNRLHFGLHIVREGTANTFTLSGLKFAVHSTEPGDSLVFVGDFTGSPYTVRRKGINYGADGVKGGGDDVVLNSGEAGTGAVNELVYVGVGNAWWPQVPGDGATPQDAIDAVASWVGSQAPFSIIGTYELYAGTTLLDSNSATVDVVTPEPTTLLLWGTTAVGLAVVRRWRGRRAA